MSDNWKRFKGWWNGKPLPPKGMIKCDLCPEYMRPDGLHWTNPDWIATAFGVAPRMYRHNLHLVRKMRGKPIVQEPFNATVERSEQE